MCKCNLVSELFINTEKKYGLINYQNIIKDGNIVEAHHKPMILKVNLSIVIEKPEIEELLDIMNAEGLLKFKVNTSDAGCFKNCFLIEITKKQNQN